MGKINTTFCQGVTHMASGSTAHGVLVTSQNHLNLAFTVCIPISIGLSELLPDSPIKLSLKYSRASLPSISKSFQTFSVIQFQRILNHLVKYIHSNDLTSLLPKSALLIFSLLEHKT